MAKKKLRPRTPSTSPENFAQEFAKGFDVDDVSTWPPDLAPWQLAAVKKAYALLEADIAGTEAEPRVLRDADAGMPTSTPLLASGRVHTLYKKGGGYIQYAVPSTAASCEAVGCCDPRKEVSAGR